MMAKREMAPDAVKVLCADGYKLRVWFENGEVRLFDAGEQLLGRKCYAPLKNPALFQTARIGYGTVVWNDELDIDPDWLYEQSTPARP